MAGSFSNYLENKILDHVLKVGAYTVPTNLYVALYTTAPSDSGGGTEVSGGNYARKLHNAYTAASSGASENTGAITFNIATGAWGTVTAFGVFDALTGGNLLLWADLDTAKVVDTGATPEFASGALDVTLD